MNAVEFGSRPPLKRVPLVIEVDVVQPVVEPRRSILLASIRDDADGSVARIGRVAGGGVIVVTSTQIDVFAEEAKSYLEAGLIPPPPIKYSK